MKLLGIADSTDCSFMMIGGNSFDYNEEKTMKLLHSANKTEMELLEGNIC